MPRRPLPGAFASLLGSWAVAERPTGAPRIPAPPGQAARTPALMVQGTASGVGKSLVCTALCRLLARRGLAVRPFKAQNMSNNAAVTADGGEIGRAQWLQAAAARVAPDVRMNPVLVKPLGEQGAEVVVLGRGDRRLAAVPWQARREHLWPRVVGALASLRAEADVLVIEGAGSTAEPNLRHADIVNMAVAREAGAAVLLVADIDRGGAFASLLGTWALLDPPDRARIAGFLLNRFRGDTALLRPACDELYRATGTRVVGVVPFVRHALPEEDALGIGSPAAGPLGTSGVGAARRALRVAAVRLPHVANFDDLDPLAAEPDVEVLWTERTEVVRDAHAVVLPGSRNTLADLRWCWETGIGAAVRARGARGLPVIGLCGGYQILGRWVSDPAGVEGGGSGQGLGVLDVVTELAPLKTTSLSRALVVASPPGTTGLEGHHLEGYEIHHGVSRPGPGARPWLMGEGACLGAVTGSAWGAYLHGLFADDRFRRAWLDGLRAETPEEPAALEDPLQREDSDRTPAAAPDPRHPDGAGRAPLPRPHTGPWALRLDAEIDRIADLVEASIEPGFLDRMLALL